MDKGKIRLALAALSVAGLVAGLTLTGCRSSCGSSCSGSGTMQPSGGSCTGSGEKPATPPEMPEP